MKRNSKYPSPVLLSTRLGGLDKKTGNPTSITLFEENLNASKSSN